MVRHCHFVNKLKRDIPTKDKSSNYNKGKRDIIRGIRIIPNFPILIVRIEIVILI